jgi:aminoglycoside phosphotransferase (APT) family kinase protein
LIAITVMEAWMMLVMDDETAVGAVLNPPQLKRFRQICAVTGKIEPRYNGFTKHVLLADDRAFLFPRNHTLVRLLERECGIYGAIEHPLIPALRGSWRDLMVSPYPFFAVTRLAGRPVDGISYEDMAPLATQLGRAIASYHGVSSDRVPQGMRKGATPRAPGSAHFTPIRSLGGVEQIAAAAASFVGASFSAEVTKALEAVEDLAPVLAHGDLHEAHLLVDESGTLTGILDWGFAGLLSPLCDFTCSQFDRELLAAEPCYGALRRQLWTAYADRRSVPLPAWDQVQLALTAFDITALAPEVQSQYFWHQGTEWRAERRAAAIDCLRALLR